MGGGIVFGEVYCTAANPSLPGKWVWIPDPQPDPATLTENAREWWQAVNANACFMGDCTDSDQPRPFPAPPKSVHVTTCACRERATYPEDGPGFWYCPACKAHGYHDLDIKTGGWTDRQALEANVKRWRARFDEYWGAHRKPDPSRCFRCGETFEGAEAVTACQVYSHENYRHEDLGVCLSRRANTNIQNRITLTGGPVNDLADAEQVAKDTARQVERLAERGLV